MRAPPRLLQDLRGGVRLAVEGVQGVTRIVRGVHGSVMHLAPPLGRGEAPLPGGLTGLVYRSIIGTTGLVGASLDGALAGVEQLLKTLPQTDAEPAAAAPITPQRDALISALNGVLGDHLERSGNPLAIATRLARCGAAGPRPLLLIHGLCMNEQQWTRKGHDHGQALGAALGLNPIYLRYNSGRHISANGATLAALLEATFAEWPVAVEGLSLIGHSMGGLVARSALHQATVAGMAWPRLLRRMVFLGTPHHGAPLERIGNWVHTGLGLSPYAAPFARLSGLRSAGITDLRHGNLLDADGAEASRFIQRDTRSAVPLPPEVACFAIAGTLGREAAADGRGDGLVSVASALGRHERPTRRLAIPASRCWIAPGVHHLDLLSSPAVYRKLRSWLK